MVENISTPAEAIRMAMGFEKDTIVFFLELQSMTDDQASRSEIATMNDEQRQQLARLTDLLSKVRN